MPDHLSAREFERFANRIDNSVNEMVKAQNEFFIKQSAINNDVANIKKKYAVITTAVISLMIGTVYSKMTETEQPVITQYKEIQKPEIKPVTKDLIVK